MNKARYTKKQERSEMGDVLIGEIEKGYGLSPTAFVLQMRNLRKKQKRE